MNVNLSLMEMVVTIISLDFAGIEETCNIIGEHYVYTGHGCLKPDYEAPALSRRYTGVTLEVCKNLCSKLYAIDCSMVAYMPTVRICHNSLSISRI